MSKGCVYLVGAGPGDPGLLTIRGKEVLGLADVVVYDYLVCRRLLDYAPLKAEQIYVGKQASAHTLTQDKINQLLIERARTGAKVVRLKGGDPFVFGRGGEEALALVEVGIAFEVVPGITAGIAAAAYAGIPVTDRGFTSGLIMMTGHEAEDKVDSSINWQSLAASNNTLAFYMGVRNLPLICKNLTKYGLDAQTPAALIRWGTTTRQEVLAGTVGSLPQLAKEVNFKPPALLIIGKVVSLRSKLKWFERRVLFGKRIVVTRARAQASRLSSRLEQLGAEVIELPTIRIQPAEDPLALQQAIAELASFDWIIFTSVNAVDAFFGALGKSGLDARGLVANRVCAIGSATAGRLKQFGIQPDAQPERYTTKNIVETLSSRQKLGGRRILCPRPDIAPKDLPEALTAEGATVKEVIAYRTVPDNTNAEQVLELLNEGQIDWITFTSSSTVKNFFAMVKPESLGESVRLASIGPATSATIREFGLSASVQGEEHTIEGLIEAIITQANAEED